MPNRSPVPVWRNYDEVFDLAVREGRILAATNGGLIQLDGGRWTPTPSPSGLRSIDATDPLTVSTAAGKSFRVGLSTWDSCGSTTRIRDLHTGMLVGPETPWLEGDPDLRRDYPQPPPAHVYCLLRFADDLLAGTSAGLYRGHAGVWRSETLPTALPVSRPNGIAEAGGTFVVGGIGGLFVGRPGAWEKVCSDAIRQVYGVGRDIWVVHGSGAVDKLDLAADRRFPDALFGSAQRAWTSAVGRSGDVLLFGGIGGWSERAKSLVGRYPPEIHGDVVLSLVGRDDIRWIGTEQSGVIRFAPSGVHRWNPGNGLTDTWVTSLCRTSSGVVAGTMHAGLFRIVGDRVSPLAGPTRRVTQVAEWRGGLAVGGMDGAWLQRGRSWTGLPTNGEETTSISTVDGRLAVATAAGIFFIPNSTSGRS